MSRLSRVRRASRRLRLPRPTAAGLPQPRRLLAWLYVGRLSLAAAIFVSVLWVWRDVSPSLTLTVTLMLVAVSTFTAVAFAYTHLANYPPGENFLYSQALFDTALITLVVHVTGGALSVFAPLYILVIAAAALLLPLLGGALIGLLASILYFADIVWQANAEMSLAVLLQIGLFATVALVTGYLGDRLRQTGTRLGAMETELRRLRLDTADILGSIPTGILTVDSDGRLAYVNPAAAEMLGLPVERWRDRPVLDALDRAAPGLGTLMGRAAAEHLPITRFETEEAAPGGLVLGVSTTLLDHAAAEQPAVTAMFQDIRERKRFELLRRRAERLEAVAELSASLAHEIKNPLASIRSAVEQLAEDGIGREDRGVLRGLVLRESDRLSRLLAEFIDFARVKMGAARPVPLPALAREVLALVQSHPDAERRTFFLRVNAPDAALVVRGTEDLLHRALLNLLLNATQWAGPGGTVRVELSRVRSDILAPGEGVHDLVQVTVHDSGPGVPPDLAEHIFDAFFTLRPGGTGLGLALVQRAMEAHGGAVFASHPDPPDRAGATFTLYLPAHEVAPPAAATAPLAPETHARQSSADR